MTVTVYNKVLQFGTILDVKTSERWRGGGHSRETTVELKKFDVPCTLHAQILDH